MVSNSTHNYINSLASLSQRLIEKKYQFTDTVLANSNLTSAESLIDSKFKNQLGYGIQEINQLDDLLNYELIIDKEYTDITSKSIIQYSVEYEIELLRRAKSIDLTELKKYDIDYVSGRKEFIKKLGFTLPNIVSFIKNADQAIVVKDDKHSFLDNYLIMKRIKYHNNYHTALIHLNHGSSRQNHLLLVSFLIVDSKYTTNNNPVRLFYNTLNWYGILSKINNKERMFFWHEKINKNNQREYTKIIELLEHEKGEGNYYVHAEKINLTDIEIKFAYGINEVKYLRDLRNDFHSLELL